MGQAEETSKAPQGHVWPLKQLWLSAEAGRDGGRRGGGGPGLSVGQRHFGQKQEAAGRAASGAMATEENRGEDSVSPRSLFSRRLGVTKPLAGL